MKANKYGLFKSLSIALCVIVSLLLGDMPAIAQQNLVENTQTELVDENVGIEPTQDNPRKGLVTEPSFETQINGDRVHASTLHSDGEIRNAISNPSNRLEVQPTMGRRQRDADGNFIPDTLQLREENIDEPLYLISSTTPTEVFEAGGFHATSNDYEDPRRLADIIEAPFSRSSFVSVSRFSQLNNTDSAEIFADWTGAVIDIPYYVYTINTPGVLNCKTLFPNITKTLK